MFSKILVANRGEIAVRIIQTCRELGIASVALYTDSDVSSRHVRLADESIRLESAADFMDPAAIVQIAQERGADAIHPGIGFMAEREAFIQACVAAGITFIGTPLPIIQAMGGKLDMLRAARDAGLPTVTHTDDSFDPNDLEKLRAQAESFGYPLVIKSCEGGRGAGERLVRSADHLDRAVSRAQAEATAVYGEDYIYLERAIDPANQVSVQIAADAHGAVVHLGEREGSLIYSNRKLIDESPAPSINDDQRTQIWAAAVDLARRFGFQGIGSFEFLIDGDGAFYFSEVKTRITIDHVLTEWRTGLDLVALQLQIAAGEPLGFTQDEVRLSGASILARIHAEDPDNHFLPSPGQLRRVRLPHGSGVRTDTYVYSDVQVPPEYSRLIGKLSVWAPDRVGAVRRLTRALRELVLIGTNTNVALLQRIMQAPNFIDGTYTTNFIYGPLPDAALDETQSRDLAVAAAVLYEIRHQVQQPTSPDRLKTGWHRDSRRLPQ
ncbi:MAG: ATP-grasp domain-containing protein [Chloroflexi bacterium]|nr:ATP-grasp domain-containing protein [Chloroflexota bacterium]